jgi:D-alanyl-D-alanine carboxypeptidase/D-alanyl-D-alanine-endopeptidase (penicillin-binding protein 4)
VVGRRYGSKTITVSGRVPAGRSGRALVTVSDPQRVAAAVFRAELVKAGVRVAKPTRVAHAPTTARVRLGLDRSITVAKLLVPFLKLSNNQHAEALTKAMGAQLRHSGSWSAGTAVTRAFVSRLGVSTKGLVLVDGSGLSRRTRVTPRQLAAVLFAAQQRSWSPAFYRALPVAADRRRMVGGTLRLRFTGTRAAHNAHAKTGSLTGVTALAGYVTGADGHRYVFAMLSHYHRISPRPLENSLVITLANHRR